MSLPLVSVVSDTTALSPFERQNLVNPKYRVLDLFSGAGGFSLGLSLLPEFETVVANDFMADALTTLKSNKPDVDVVFGDICDPLVKESILALSRERRVNVVIGGPPCQGFSNKGKKLGLKDPRNFLFREYLKVVEALRPEIFVIENVKAMSSSTDGWFMAQILKEIDRLGYVASSGILKASDFGVPQSRQRTFIIAAQDRFIPLPEPRGADLVTVKEAISDLAFLGSGEGADQQAYVLPPQSSYQEKMRTNSPTLHNHKATNHAPIALKKLAMIPPEGGKEHIPQELLGKQKFKTTWGRLRWNDVSPTIDTRFDTPSNGTNSHPELDRAITPREAARLQSFPDSYVFYGTKTNIGKQIGNAVPPLLAKAVGESILATFSDERASLYCGDATKFLVDMAVGGLRVDHVITDPPYNISKVNNFQTMTSSQRKGVDFGDWDKGFDLVSWIKPSAEMLTPGGTFIVFNSYRNLTPIIESLESAGLLVKDVIRWIKKNPMPRNIERRYVQDAEFAIWAVKPGSPWVFNKPRESKYLRAEFVTSIVAGHERTIHPTQKSKALMASIIRIHSQKNDLILDPFMGSGSTGVAALSVGRRFIGIEQSQEYFEIAKNRIEGV